MKSREQAMTESSPDHQNLADDLLKQFAQTQENSFSAILTRENLDEASPESWNWHGRRVLIADGSTLSMPDTEENQNAYPQHGGQKKGQLSHPEN